MSRMFVVLLVSAIFGLLCGLCTRSGDRFRVYCLSAVAALCGVAAASLLEGFFPVLFNHLTSFQSWFEWVPFVGSGYTLLLLPRSLILLPLGFAAGYGVARLGRTGMEGGWRSHLAVATFLAGFLFVWGTQAEHLPRGVETRVYVYRLQGTDYNKEDSEAWVNFLEWNWSPHFGYEVYSAGLSLRLGLVDLDIGSQGPPTYVFVKEYLVDGKRTSMVRASRSGYLSAWELGSFFRNFARSRTSPGVSR